MSDLQNYIKNRKMTDKAFAENYDEGYEEFKIGIMIKQIRIKNGMTQDDLAQKIHTTKSAISRMENHAEDIKISSLEKIARALGKKVKIELI
jgi:DNA-binding XRE family transcriptional regulator